MGLDAPGKERGHRDRRTEAARRKKKKGKGGRKGEVC